MDYVYVSELEGSMRWSSNSEMDDDSLGAEVCAAGTRRSALGGAWSGN
jgi:hypothetical protein